MTGTSPMSSTGAPSAAVSRPGTAAPALLVLALLSVAACAPEETPTPSVTVGETTFEVEIAATPDEMSKGLSGRDGLAAGSGMMFVYEVPRVSTFWMKGMRFPLDFIWIGQDCRVADTESDAGEPPTGTQDSDLPLYRSDGPVLYGLEVNAGDVERLGIEPGDRVVFADAPVSEGGC